MKTILRHMIYDIFRDDGILTIQHIISNKMPSDLISDIGTGKEFDTFLTVYIGEEPPSLYIRGDAMVIEARSTSRLGNAVCWFKLSKLFRYINNKVEC